MRIAKPLLLVTTPLGVAGGLYEGYRMTGGLVFLMVAMLALVGVAVGSIAAVIRRERAAEAAAAAAATATATARPPAGPQAGDASRPAPPAQ